MEKLETLNVDSPKKRLKVCFFKALADDEPDPYCKALMSKGYVASIVPTLDFMYHNQEALSQHLRTPHLFKGIIFTSKRSVKAVHQVVADYGIDLNPWREKGNYSVGGATSSLAQELLNMETRGEDTGNSEALYRYMHDMEHRDLDPAGSLFQRHDQRFLYPSSDRGRFPFAVDAFQKPTINILEVCCYKTVPHKLLRENWGKLVAEQGLPDVCVFFSPSCVEFSIDMIRLTYRGKPFERVAIGTATHSELEERQMPATAVCKKPNPAGIVAEIEKMPEPENWDCPDPTYYNLNH